MIRVLHIVGIQNGWAICLRAEALRRAMADEVQAEIASFERWRDGSPPDLTAFDFVHVHGLQIVPLIQRALGGCPAPWGFEVISERSMKHAEAMQHLTRRASVCFAKNPRLADEIRPYISCPVVYVPNGVNTRLFRPRTCRVGWVGNKRDGRHLAYKGVPLIQEAIERLNGELAVLIALTFTPDPSQYPEVLPQAQLVPYYQSLDALVCGSVAEGSSNVVNEALACGVPVVSTRVGMAPELADDGARLAVVERSAEGIVAGLRNVLRDVIATRRCMLSYDWVSPRIAGTYLAAYHAACNGKGSGN